MQEEKLNLDNVTNSELTEGNLVEATLVDVSKTDTSIPIEKKLEELSIAEIESELEKLLKSKPIHSIKVYVEKLCTAADKIYNTEKETKLAEYAANGGEAKDFLYENKDYTLFKNAVREYRTNLKKFFKDQKAQEETNLKTKLALIEELKALYTSPNQDTKFLFDQYNQLKNKWKETGAIPKNSVSEVYKNYHHHLDNFFDFLDINKELRDAYFEKNLAVRKSIIQKAEKLLEEKNAKKLLSNLRFLHSSWKQDAVPVAKEHREETWSAFKELSDKIREKANAILKEVSKEAEAKLTEKKEILESLKIELANDFPTLRKERMDFIQSTEKKFEHFKSILTPNSKTNKQLWGEFRTLSNTFYTKKNDFFKKLKNEANTNIEKKKELIALAKAHEESTDWEESIQILKQLQDNWKKVGFVPRKLSDELWSEFRKSCDTFFERLKNKTLSEKKKEEKSYTEKKIILDKLKKEKSSEIDFEKQTKEWIEIGVNKDNGINLEYEYEHFVYAYHQKNNLDISKVETVKIDTINTKTNVEKDLEWLENEIAKSSALSQLYRTGILQNESSLGLFSVKSKENPLLKELHNKIETENNLLKNGKSYLKKLRTKLRELKETLVEEGSEDWRGK